MTFCKAVVHGLLSQFDEVGGFLDVSGVPPCVLGVVVVVPLLQDLDVEVGTPDVSYFHLSALFAFRFKKQYFRD